MKGFKSGLFAASAVVLRAVAWLPMIGAETALNGARWCERMAQEART